VREHTERQIQKNEKPLSSHYINSDDTISQEPKNCELNFIGLSAEKIS